MLTQPQKLFDPPRREYEALSLGKSTQCGLPWKQLGLIQRIFMLIPAQCAPTGGHHIAAPIHIGSVGQRNDKAIIEQFCNDWCLVCSARTASDVLEGCVSA